MSAEKKFDLAMIGDVEANIENARVNETRATQYLVDSAKSAEERAKWEKVAQDELDQFNNKKAELARMREEAFEEAGSMAA